jgi:hypothetical protein
MLTILLLTFLKNTWGKMNKPEIAQNADTWLNLESLYEQLFSFLDATLPSFPAKLQEIVCKEQPNFKGGEDVITQQLDIFLGEKKQNDTVKYGYSFIFQNQYKQTGGQGRTDIGVLVTAISYTKAVCWIEAKRLPIPDTNKGKRDEKEYVIDENKKMNGGIVRYKANKHGENLPYSIMLAYIQTHNATHWHTQVNTWIDEQIIRSSNTELTWAAQDKLQHIATLGAVEKYHSKHERINSKVSNDIELHHYWLNLTNN